MAHTVDDLVRGWDSPVQILTPEGELTGEPPEPDIADDKLVEMYRYMTLARNFDERAVMLQRQGRMGTYAPLSGQEAAQIGSGSALREQDWVFPSYREHGVMLAYGLPLKYPMIYWMGHERGNQVPEDKNVFPVAVPIATQTLHAVGAAWGARLQGDDTAVIVYFGDGGTSEGDFHEAMNFAGTFEAPVVFFCQNNQYAISVPRERQTASETLAQKAVAYGFEGIRVDGNDILAVYDTTKQALDKARDGGGPTMIEAVTYRYGPHTTADDPTRYRDDEELAKWRDDRDPIKRFYTYLVDNGLWSEDRDGELEEDIDEEVRATVKELEAADEIEPLSMFDYVFEELPPELKQQRAHLENELAERGEA